MKNIFLLILIIVLIAYAIYLYKIYSLINYWTKNTKYIVRYVPNYENDVQYDKIIITHNDKFTQTDLFKYFNSFTGSRIPGYGDIQNSKNNNNVSNLTGTKEISYDISADRLNHYISFLAMIDPSLNLFTSVSTINLMPNGQWVNQLNIPLYINNQDSPIAHLHITKV